MRHLEKRTLMDASEELIVTPDQYADGYVENVHGVITRRIWQLVREAPDGNYIVRPWSDNAIGGVHKLVQEDLAERFAIGVAEYGGTLDPFNGRNALQDLYEELLDACCYLKQALIEQEQTLAH